MDRPVEILVEQMKKLDALMARAEQLRRQAHKGGDDFQRRITLMYLAQTLEKASSEADELAL